MSEYEKFSAKIQIPYCNFHLLNFVIASEKNILNYLKRLLFFLLSTTFWDELGSLHVLQPHTVTQQSEGRGTCENLAMFT